MNTLEFIKSDLYRYHGRNDWPHLVKQYFTNKGFHFSFWFRLANAYHRIPIIGWLLRFQFSRLKRRYVTDMSFRPSIGPGFCIYHLYTSSIHPDALLGKNFVLMHNVTIGSGHSGTPIIGDNVFVGPGSVVFGGVKIGNNVAIGPNSVVIKDVPDDCVVAGNPAKIISQNGSSHYCRNRI